MVVVEGLLNYTQKRRKKKRNESDEIWSKLQHWSRHHSNRHAESRRKGGRSFKILKKLLNWRNTRKPIWADKEAREPRDQRLRASRCITIWGNQVGVKMLQATKSVPWEVRKTEKSWETVEALSVFARLPWECQPSVSASRVFSCLHSRHHLLFCCLTHYEIPYVLEPLKSLYLYSLWEWT